MRYLLDTNILSDLMRHPRGAVAEHTDGIGGGSLCTSIIVVAELRFGIAKRGATDLGRKLAQLLGALDVLAFEAPADVFYAQLRADLERRGLTIGANDLLIASQAMALGCTVVTDNVREFMRVDGLAVENWLR